MTLRGVYGVVSLLLAALAPIVRADNNEDLLTASRRGDLEAVKKLVAAGADIETKTRHGITPLFYAARNGHEPVVAFLLEKGAKADIADTFYKMTAVGAAAEEGHAGVVKRLLDKGAGGREDALSAALIKHDARLAEAAMTGGGLSPQYLAAALAVAENAGAAEVIAVLKAAGAKRVQVDPARLESYAGKYQTPNAAWMIELKDGKLVGSTGGEDFPLAALDEQTFVVASDFRARLKFETVDGKVTGVTLRDSRGVTVAKRVE